MARYLFSSHDGYGLGHVRRNVLLARGILARDPDAHVTLVTGVPVRPRWLQAAGLDVVAVPSLLKGADGRYRNSRLSMRRALAERHRIFAETVRTSEPDVIVVDRHPFGTVGELRDGLADARRTGAHIVLGLRDIIDERDVVRAEISGPGWRHTAAIFDEALVYGDPRFCDHEDEYGVPLPLTYCGWVVEQPVPTGVEPDLLVISAGGGGDGAGVYALGVQLVRLRPDWRAVIAAGPFATRWDSTALADEPELRGRIRLERDGGSTGEWFSRAAASIQMAGYNSTVEALVSGVRPVLVPRRFPRREQAIRSARLASLGLADIVDESASAAELSWLLDQPRRLSPGACERAGINLNGADVAAELLSRRHMVGAA